MIRQAIRKRLIETVLSLEGRVFESHIAGPKEEMPYVVLLDKELAVQDSKWEGVKSSFEIWPFVSRTSFQKVDELCQQIIAALSAPIITEDGSTIVCTNMMAGPDSVIQDWQAITRGISVDTYTIKAVPPADEYMDDIWLEAIEKFTAGLLGENWHVYRAVHPDSIGRPAVVWRLLKINTKIAGSGGLYVVEKEFAGHVVGESKNQEANAALKILQEMPQGYKIPLSLTERKYLTSKNPQFNAEADSVKTGQIRVSFHRFTARPEEEVPLMMKVHIGGKKSK